MTEKRVKKNVIYKMEDLSETFNFDLSDRECFETFKILH